MHYHTIDSQSFGASKDEDKLFRQTSSASTKTCGKKIAQNLITKTISNYFIPPDKMLLPSEERQELKCTSNKPFFTKNRKAIESKNRKLKGFENPVVVPNGFKNILRAKSTVIKQKNLQQFYINREGRDAELEKTQLDQFGNQNSKSNLFRTNFPQKKDTRKKIYSVSLEKNRPESKSNNNREGLFSKQMRAIIIQSLTDDLGELALKEKDFYLNFGEKNKNQSIQGSASKPHWRSLRKKHKPALDKENYEPMISPWGGTQNEDICF